MESVYHKVPIPCIGEFEYMFYLISLPDHSEIVVRLVKMYNGLGIGKRCDEELKEQR
jgi:hypothetical protein